MTSAGKQETKEKSEIVSGMRVLVATNRKYYVPGHAYN